MGQRQALEKGGCLRGEEGGYQAKQRVVTGALAADRNNVFGYLIRDGCALASSYRPVERIDTIVGDRHAMHVELDGTRLLIHADDGAPQNGSNGYLRCPYGG